MHEAKAEERAPILRSAVLLGAILLGAAARLGAAAQAAAPEAPDPAMLSALRAMLERAGMAGEGPELPHGDRQLFESVLNSEAFLHGTAGLFDVYVYRADQAELESQARALLDGSTKGLLPAGELLQRRFAGEGGGEGDGQGLVSGRRFPIVLARTAQAHGGPAFDQLVALLDHCESGDFSGWKPANEVWNPANRAALAVRSWEVLLLNLSHPEVLEAGGLTDFLPHGLGYHAIAHVANRLLRLGSWGLVPPWLANGLIDELDIAAYGEAWVGGDWWIAQTPGWYREGWSGFVPQGTSPPPPVTGPPADLAVSVSKSGDSWAHRDNSKSRHWSDLHADLKSEAPASFRYMAENESFLPRDRALARCTLHVLLELRATGRGAPRGLLERLDEPTEQRADGMPGAEPLPKLVADAIGGVRGVDDFERLSLWEVLEELGRTDIVDRLVALGAEELLELNDHRDHSQWLYGHPDLDMAARNEIFSLILAAEYHQQLREWQLLGEALDRGMRAALKTASAYPRLEKARALVGAEFHKGARGG